MEKLTPDEQSKIQALIAIQRRGFLQQSGGMGTVDGCSGEPIVLARRKRLPEYAVGKFIR